MSGNPIRRFIIPIHSHRIVDFLDLVEKKLDERGHSVTYIPQDEYVATTAQRKLNPDNIQLDYLDFRVKSQFDTLCEKYGIDSPRNLVFPQMVYDYSYDAPSHRPYWFSGTDSLPYERYINLLHRTLEYLDKQFENGNGGVPLQNQGGEVLRRALQRVADYHDYPSIQMSFSPVPGQVLLRSTERMHFPVLHNERHDGLTKEQRKAAQEFRTNITENRQEVIGNTDQSGSLSQNIRRKSRRIHEHWDDLTPVISAWLRLRVGKPAIGSIIKRFYVGESTSQDFIRSNKYVFYPIQYLRESRVTMRAPEYYNQLWFIEYLSRSLPRGYELVVKDHPQQLGALPLSHARKMRRYSTAIAPTIPAREVIAKADAVVTLNNTVGFEALMMGKPVVALGDAFYSHAGYTRDVNNLRNLPQALKEAVDSDGLSDEEVIELTHGILDSSYPGVWDDNSQENITRFTNSILDFVNSLERPPIE